MAKFINGDKFTMRLPKGALQDKLFLEGLNVLTFDKAVQIAKTRRLHATSV